MFKRQISNPLYFISSAHKLSVCSNDDILDQGLLVCLTHENMSSSILSTYIRQYQYFGSNTTICTKLKLYLYVIEKCVLAWKSLTNMILYFHAFQSINLYIPFIDKSTFQYIENHFLLSCVLHTISCCNFLGQSHVNGANWLSHAHGLLFYHSIYPLYREHVVFWYLTMNHSQLVILNCIGQNFSMKW